MNSTADRINGLEFATALLISRRFTPPATALLPGAQFLIHPNIKASFEYQFRPEQFVTVATDSTTGNQLAENPFRVNTALFGLEFVY